MATFVPEGNVLTMGTGPFRSWNSAVSPRDGSVIRFTAS